MTFIGQQVKSAGSNIGSDDLTIGAAGTRELKWAGALSTDKLVFRNSGDTEDLAHFAGDGSWRIGLTGANNYMQWNGTTFYAGKSTGFLEFAGTTSRIYNANRLMTITQGTGDFHHSMSAGGAHFYQGTFQLNTGLNAPSGATNSMLVGIGTAPTVNKTNCSWWYSADIVAGNSAPHFRTENGSVIKLYLEAALTAIDATATDATIGTNDTITNNIRTRLNELESRLQAQGLLT